MKKAIMTRAWEMYKAAGCTTKTEFGLALKAAWAESRKPTIDVIIKKLDAKKWVRPGTNEIRYYVEFAKAMGHRPQTNADKQIKIWFDINGNLHHNCKTTRNDEYIRKYVEITLAS